MTQELVRIIVNDDGEKIAKKEQKWCAIANFDCVRTICGFVMDGDSSIEIESKTVNRGGITCADCLGRIKEIKAIKL